MRSQHDGNAVKGALFQGGQTGLESGCTGGSLHPCEALRLCNLRNCSQITSYALAERSTIRLWQVCKCSLCGCYLIYPAVTSLACGRQAALIAWLVAGRAYPGMRGQMLRWGGIKGINQGAQGLGIQNSIETKMLEVMPIAWMPDHCLW